ncbi:MAG: hypothetical protein MUO82_01465 [Candidatus Thermoplasmatota archaeon]|nr:hypothetical protein [Candidatus Thermoplasmatota archaeon]
MKKMKTPQTDKLLQYWSNNPRRWIQFCELRREFVKVKGKDHKLIHREDGLNWDPKTGKTSKEKTLPIYNYDSGLSKDLDKLTEYGILENYEEPQKKGKPKSFYRLSKKYEFEPLKILHQKSINICPINNILSFSSPKLTFYLANLSIKDDFTEEDAKSIQFIADKIFSGFDDIDIIFKKISERKANRKWKEYIDNLEASPETKLYFWLFFIGEKTIILHPSLKFLLKKCVENITDELILSEKKIDRESGRSSNITVSEKLLECTKFLNEDIKDFPSVLLNLTLGFKPFYEFRALHLPLFDKILKIWEEKANNFVKDISYTLIQKKFGYSTIDEVSEKISIEYKKHEKTYRKIIKETTNILLDSKMYVAVKEPSFVISEDLQDAYHLDKDQAAEILSSNRKVLDPILSDREVLDPFPRENIYKEFLKKRIEKYPEKFPEYNKKETEVISKHMEKKGFAFFRKNKYFDGFEERLKELEYDKEESYSILEEYANIFDMPILPDEL